MKIQQLKPDSDTILLLIIIILSLYMGYMMISAVQTINTIMAAPPVPHDRPTITTPIDLTLHITHPQAKTKNP